MCHWVSDTPYQVLTAVAARKNKSCFCQPTSSDFSRILVRKEQLSGNVLHSMRRTFSHQLIHKPTYTRRDWRVTRVFKKMAQYSFTLTHAAISYSFAGEEATAIKAFKLWFKQMFRFTFIFIHLLLWLCVKQHDGGFVPAIWSTVNYSWPVDAMPTTASKWITLCWRIMDIYSSGILFTIFCKK